MKYLLNRTQYRQITEAFDGRMKPDIHGKNTILSLYFDTPDDLDWAAVLWVWGEEETS